MVDTEREVVRRRAGRTRQWMGRGCRRTLNTEAGAGMPEPLKELGRLVRKQPRPCSRASCGPGGSRSLPADGSVARGQQ